uniref:Uncharacterized protein n=1 Tax=Anguilla anguilla TaxID=7936 RepID=A0A0E9RFK5_ANGAN
MDPMQLQRKSCVSRSGPQRLLNAGNFKHL